MKNNFDINEQPSPLNNNYENIQNSKVIALTRYCKILSISYLITWISCIIFMIGAVSCYYSFLDISHLLATDPHFFDPSSSYPNGYGHNVTNEYGQQIGIPSPYAGFITCIVFVAILGFALLMLGVGLISGIGKLKNYYEYSRNLSTLFIIGLVFFGFTSAIASILTILDCNKIESKSSIS